MKKTVSLFCTFIVSLSMIFMPTSAEEDNTKDPYKTIYASDYDDCIINTSTGKKDFKERNGYVGGLRVNDYLIYKNVDFTRQPKSVDLHLGVSPENVGKIELRLDGTKGKVLLSANVKASDWENGAIQTELIKEKVSGVHDLCFTWTESTCHIFSMTFYTDEVINYISPYVSYKDTFKYSDISENPFFNDILTASSLGLITSYGTDCFKPEMPVTRQEFAKTVYSIMNMQPEKNNYFSDINENTVNYEIINSVRARGYMNGISETEFAPLGFLSVSDAAIVAVRMLGYEYLAELKGGYPVGYRLVASDLGILDGISGEDVIRRSTLARWVVNVINSDYSQISTIKNDSVRYDNIKGILSLTKEINKSSGMVTANQFTSVYSPLGNTNKNYVEIDGKTYFCGDTYAASYLGMYCDYYYSEENGKKTIISIVPNRNVSIKTVTAQKMKKIDNMEISFFDEKNDDKTVTLETNAGTTFLVNGKALDKQITEIIKASDFSGEILWIDNDSNNVADVVIANMPVTYKISSVSDDSITDLLTGNTCMLKDNDFVFIKGNQEIKMSEVASGSIASVYESKNDTGSKLIRIILNDSNVTAGITAIDNKGIYLDGNLYKSNLDLSVNDYGVFYLNEYNQVVYFEKKMPANDFIGLYLGYSKGGSSEFSDKLSIKIYTDKGMMNIYDVNKSFCCDGIKFSDYNAAVNGNGVYVGIGAVTINSPVKYRLNSEGKIILMDTTLIGSANDDDMMKTILSSHPELYYRTNLKMLTQNGRMKYPIKQDGKVFSYYNYTDGTSEADYSIKVVSKLTSNEILHSSEIYSSTGDNIGDILIDTARRGSSTWSMSMLVSDTSSCVDKNGDETSRIYGYVNGKLLKFAVNCKSYNNNTTYGGGSPLMSTVDSLEKGDIIKYILNSNDEITEIKLIFSNGGAAKNKMGVSNTLYNDNVNKSSYWGASDMTNINILGIVEDKEDSFIKIRLFDGGEEYVPIEGKTVMRCDLSDKSIRSGLSAAAVDIGDVIVVGITSMSVNQLVVYENTGF